MTVAPKGSSHRVPGLVLVDHWFDVPLDHARPDGETLRLSAREVRAPGREAAERPWLVFLQGGPGFAAPRPFDAGGWIGRALRDYRVLLLDQRGTGRSTPVCAATVTLRGSPARQAEYLSHFRADAIVRDCELVRRRLLPAGERWTVLGQSYGGFCTAHYLSSAPEGLAAALFTGGLPPIGADCETVYRHTYPRVLERNRRYYARYPGDVERVGRVAARLRRGDVRLPCGDVLSPRRLQLLGLLLGFSDGMEQVHYLFEEAFLPDGDELGYAFLRGYETLLHYDTNPIFSLLHEACYTEGVASRWAAQRLRDEHPALDPDGDGPLHFTGEMIYPWFFEEIGALRPLAGAAGLLAEKSDWPALYDAERLLRNEVPAVAVVYDDDMYVDRDLSLRAAAGIGNLRVWTTNAWEHNGLRADGERLLGRLLDLLAGRA